MNIEEKITQHLVKKYKPLAVLLTGSRAKGYAKENSNWDIIMLSNKPDLYVSELFMGQELDTQIKNIAALKHGVLENIWSPYQEIKVLYDNSQSRAQKIVSATKKAYAKGPKKLSHVEFQARKNFDRRKIYKLITLEHNQNGFFEYAGIFFNGIIKHWFDLKQLWPIDPISSLEYFRQKDKTFYKLLTTISSTESNKQKIKAAKLVYNHLYKDKL